MYNTLKTGTSLLLLFKWCARLMKIQKTIMIDLNQILEEIAIDELDIPTLETRGGDSVDFHDVAVWSLKRALKKAFLIGSLSEKKINWNKAPVWAKTVGYTSFDESICWSSEENPKGFLFYKNRPINSKSTNSHNLH